jgi:hypothetical protein
LKRAILAIIIFLLLGAATSIAIAWAAVLGTSARKRNSFSKSTAGSPGSRAEREASKSVP